VKVEIRLADPRFCTGCLLLDIDEEGRKYCMKQYFTAEERKTVILNAFEKTIRPELCKELHE